jgi:hypothetical protein
MDARAALLALEDSFVHRHVAPTESAIAAMLDAVGLLQLRVCFNLGASWRAVRYPRHCRCSSNCSRGMVPWRTQNRRAWMSN